jgi:hypothetical protein
LTIHLIDPSRHVPLRPIPWGAASAAEAIDEIVPDALDHFDPFRFWPGHPLDGQADGNASFYFGATGVIWALEYLRRVGATKRQFDFRASMDRLLVDCRDQFHAFCDYGAHGSFLFGDLGAALLVMELTPDRAIADLIEARTIANQQLPLRWCES